MKILPNKKRWECIIWYCDVVTHADNVSLVFGHVILYICENEISPKSLEPKSKSCFRQNLGSPKI